MGYLKDLDPWFAEVLQRVPVDQLEPVLRAIKKKIVETYKNGIIAGKLSMAEKQAEELVKESLEE